MKRIHAIAGDYTMGNKHITDTIQYNILFCKYIRSRLRSRVPTKLDKM